MTAIIEITAVIRHALNTVTPSSLSPEGKSSVCSRGYQGVLCSFLAPCFTANLDRNQSILWLFRLIFSYFLDKWLVVGLENVRKRWKTLPRCLVLSTNPEIFSALSQGSKGNQEIFMFTKLELHNFASCFLETERTDWLSKSAWWLRTKQVILAALRSLT